VRLSSKLKWSKRSNFNKKGQNK